MVCDRPVLAVCVMCDRSLGRYHVFVCAVCNDGTELVKRLDIRWQEVVHLALFNLTVASQKRYHDLDLALLPWIDEHWDLLQAPIYVSGTREMETGASEGVVVFCRLGWRDVWVPEFTCLHMLTTPAPVFL